MKTKNRKTKKRKGDIRSADPLKSIRTGTDPALSTVCKPVEPGEDISEITKLMRYILLNVEHAVGLSANQLGFDKRVIAILWYGEVVIMINPEITGSSDEQVAGNEGCLSYPDKTREIIRSRWVDVTWLDEDGFHCAEMFGTKDLGAVKLLHEVDHLDGICRVSGGRK